MQFVIARNALQKELAFVQGIVERKNTIPVLANILIESAGEDSIVLLERIGRNHSLVADAQDFHT